MSKTLLGAIDGVLTSNNLRHFFGMIPKREELSSVAPAFISYIHLGEKVEFQGFDLSGGKASFCRIYEDNNYQFQCYGLTLETAEAYRDTLEDVLDGFIPTLDMKLSSPFRRDEGLTRVSEELSSEAEFIYLASVNYYVRTEYALSAGRRVKP